MEPAPYGGFMTRTIDAEKEQQEKLKEQQVEIQINGQTETLRPEALHIKGVDNLATDDIKNFVDFYLNYEKNEQNGQTEFQQLSDVIKFRVQWIDDANVNIVFKTHEDAKAGLKALSVFAGPNNSIEEIADFSPEYVSLIVQERETKPYNPSLELKRYLQTLQKEQEKGEDLFEAKKEQIEQQQQESAAMDEDENSVVLHVRQSLQSDRKVKNAAAYSRYYLLHGEPDRLRPRPARRERGERNRGNFSRDDDNEDLFAAKLGDRSRRDQEEDLFASKLRERSPERR